MVTRLYSVEYIHERKAISRSCAKLREARALAKEIVERLAPAATVIEYAVDAAPIVCLAMMHDGSRSWWSDRRVVCVLKTPRERKTS